MTQLPPGASVAQLLEGAKLNAPSAARNTPVIMDLLSNIAPAQGCALELASGTGQHIVALATALPALNWQPTDVDPDRIASINAYAAQAGLSNLAKARHLDAATAGWAAREPAYDMIHLVNLLHLISDSAVKTVLSEAVLALAPDGKLVIYGPFARSGVLTSPGDQQFDADLRAADPTIGYKNDLWIKEVLTAAGLSLIEARELPANNLAFIASKGSP